MFTVLDLLFNQSTVEEQAMLCGIRLSMIWFFVTKHHPIRLKPTASQHTRRFVTNPRAARPILHQNLLGPLVDPKF